VRVTLLGSGDSVGTPKIGCDCPTCAEARNDGRSRRRRPGFLVEQDGFTLLVDSGPDMRQQLLDAGVKRVDALLWTHAHWDHFAGFPEFWRVQQQVEVYGAPAVLDHVLGQFHFISHRRNELSPYRPTEIGGIPITLFEVNHPTALPTCGLVIDGPRRRLVVSGDTLSAIPPESLRLMRDADVLFVDAISPTHQQLIKHMNAQQALSLVKELSPGECYFYHLSHSYPPHAQATEQYPLGFDGLSVDV